MLEPVCEIASSSHIAISVLRHRMAVEWLVWGMELVEHCHSNSWAGQLRAWHI